VTGPVVSVHFRAFFHYPD